MRAFKCQTHRPKYTPNNTILLLLQLLYCGTHLQAKKIHTIDEIFAFYCPSFTMPLHRIKWLFPGAIFAGGQADGCSQRQTQFSSLTMCHSKPLKISVLETPGFLLNLGHWQNKALLKAPMCDTDLLRTIPHARDITSVKSVLHNYKLGLG